MTKKLAGAMAVVLAVAHLAFVIVRPDLRGALALSLVSVLLLAAGGILCWIGSRWAVPCLVGAIVAITPMPVLGAEIDSLYLVGMVAITVVAMIAYVRQRPHDL